MAARFRPGDQTLFRFVWPWKVFSAKPATVVEHTAERVVLWLAPGTQTKAPPGFRVSIPDIAPRNWQLGDGSGAG